MKTQPRLISTTITSFVPTSDYENLLFKLVKPCNSLNTNPAKLACRCALTVVLISVAFAVAYSSTDLVEAHDETSCEAAEQREVLEDFYDDTNGPDWNIQQGQATGSAWKSPQPLSTWQGVAVDGISGCVSELNLSNSGIIGEFPNLSHLAGLQKLYLNNNQLQGDVNGHDDDDDDDEHDEHEHLLPESLVELDLSFNKLNGEFVHLSEMESLKILRLSNNMLSGEIHNDDLPEDLISIHGSFNYLQEFDVSNNMLNGELPDGLDRFRNLQKIDVSNNMFEGDLPDLSKTVFVTEQTQEILSGLQELVVYPGNPGLKGVVTSSKLPLTLTIEPSPGQFSTIPVNTLKKLVIGHFLKVPGEDPENPDRLCLDNDDVELNNWVARSDTTFTGVFCGAGTDDDDLITGEEEHTCEDNAQRTALKEFYDAMDGDNWHDSTNWNTTEPLGTWYGLITAEHHDEDHEDDDCVTEIDLSNNGLSGELTRLEGMTALHGLILSHNEITGQIPAMGHLHMEELDLSHNQMSGQINLEHLASEIHTLLLNDNMFSGPFPDLSGTRHLSSGPGIETGAIVLGSFASQNTQPMTASNFPSQAHPAADGLPELVRADLSNNMFTGKLPNMSVSSQQPVPTSPRRVPIPSKLRELIVYPGNPGLSGVVDSRILPLNTLKKLVIGHTRNILGEDPQRPERLCLASGDIVLNSWIIRSDTTFTGGFCGGATGETGSAYVSRLGRIEPGISSLRVRVGDDVTLGVKIYGRQGIQDQSMADQVTFEWKEDDRTLEGTSDTIIYSVPSNPGTYKITASLDPRTECHGLGDPNTNCTASFVVQVLRSSIASEPAPVPVNPTGDIPTIIVDPNGRQYEVFTPVEGGRFADGVSSLTAGPGAVPNGDVVGLRIDDAGATSNAGMTIHRYTLAGNSYNISAVGVNGMPVLNYQLNATLEFCAPVPDMLRSNISEVATIALNADGTLTVLSTSIRITSEGLLGCANLSTVPVIVAHGTSGIPAAIPTATLEPTPESPDTGGKAPSTNGWNWLLLLTGISIAGIGVMFAKTLRRDSRA